MRKFIYFLFSLIMALFFLEDSHAQIPGTPINALPNASPFTIENGDYIAIYRNGVTYKATPYAFPSSGNIILSSGLGVSMTSLSETDGSCAVGSAGMWTVAPCITYTPGTLLSVAGVESIGTTFTIASGCGTGGSAPTTLTGGSVTGSFVANTTACSPVITLPTAIHGWWCSMTDITHPADTFTQTAKSSTSCTMTVASAVSDSDVIIFHAEAY